MSKRLINGTDFMHMILTAAGHLHARVNDVNALNVFPVPDGDTGTNMNLTLTSGVEELKKKPSPDIGKAAEILSRGLLMGARGNSGVILSQLFRGFAKAVAGQAEIDTIQFAAALQEGVDTAYKAVAKPVEGTILTVSREAARHAVTYSRRVADMVELMREVWRKAQETVAKTPDMLPVLKQVGVVDSGGQGLVYIYEGFVAALSGEKAVDASSVSRAAQAADSSTDVEYVPSLVPVSNLAEEAHRMFQPKSAQAKLSAEDIEYGYCTEFLVKLAPGKNERQTFNEAEFRLELERFGDSLLVVADDELVKVHIHAEYPGSVLNYAMKFGDLSRIKIENMREQHAHIVEGETTHAAEERLGAVQSATARPASKRYGIIAVAAGEGIAEILKSLGVDYVLQGGQTMNPSTEHIVKAIEDVDAQHIFILPNNSNIILAAEQAKQLTDKPVAVIPSKTIPQGIAAAIAFRESATTEENTAAMTEAIKGVRSGQITYAVRDSAIDGINIAKGDYIGILDNKIVTATPQLQETCRLLLERMMDGGGEIITVYTGQDVAEEHVSELVSFVEQTYPDADLEIVSGGQPLYYYIISVE